jgi:hypothetical protein
MKTPYGFYPCLRPCPVCRGRLASSTPLTKEFTQGLLHNLGFSCFCEGCNNRFRAKSRLRFEYVAWLGNFGRWLWWQFSTLEVTSPPTDQL